MIDLVWCGRLGCEGGQSRLEESSRWLATYLLKIRLVFFVLCGCAWGVFLWPMLPHVICGLRLYLLHRSFKVPNKHKLYLFFSNLNLFKI
jgi:hypothetical protein